MTNEKVTIPREVAEAIEELRKEDCTNFDVMRRAHGALITEPDLVLYRWAFRSQEGSPDLLMCALVNGYNVEKSPEEKLRNICEEYRANYRSTEDWERDNAYAEGVLFGIEETLELLDITIEGIND